MTYSEFDPSGRERYQTVMKQAEYAELPEFFGKGDESHFDCASCEYMREDEKSPTGYWCEKLSFPDLPSGCCRYWEPLPELDRHQD